MVTLTIISIALGAAKLLVDVIKLVREEQRVLPIGSRASRHKAAARTQKRRSSLPLPSLGCQVVAFYGAISCLASD